ncbi:SGNH/GDSL hydrolase family protein [Methylomonas sp. CM2]|uniref:SGNH/GDSL hydrolase family protein n=1 Tax=Methylomonas sp. CM2 TaxID=3417647 RepID=UPI003CF8E9B3
MGTVLLLADYNFPITHNGVNHSQIIAAGNLVSVSSADASSMVSAKIADNSTAAIAAAQAAGKSVIDPIYLWLINNGGDVYESTVLIFDSNQEYLAAGGLPRCKNRLVLIDGRLSWCDGISLINISGSGGMSSVGLAQQSAGLLLPCGEMSNLGSVTSSQSWRLVQTVPEHYSAVRAHIFNASTTLTQANVKCNFSVADSYANVLKPTIAGAVDNSRWTNFTWSGAATVTRPVASAAEIPSHIVSDWLPVKSLDRLDGGALPLAYATMYHPDNTGVGYTNISGAQAFFNGLSGNNHIFSMGNQTTDAIATPDNWTNSNTQSPVFIPFGLEFLFNKQVISIACFGDSTTAGAGNTVNMSFCMQAAAELDNLGIAVNIWMQAQTGEDQINYFARLMNLLALTKPKVIYFQSWSVNGSSNYTFLSENQMSRLLQLVSYCEQNNIILITDTPQPYVAAGGAALSNSELLSYNKMLNLILNINSPNVIVMNFTGLHDPEKPGVWNATYGYDQYHPNPAGHIFKRDKLVNAITSLI